MKEWSTKIGTALVVFAVSLTFLGSIGFAEGQKLDINSASLEELKAVDGISPELAELIVKHRDGVGHFANLLELLPLFDEASLLHLEKQLKIAPPTEEQKIRRGIVFGEG